MSPHKGCKAAQEVMTALLRVSLCVEQSREVHSLESPKQHLSRLTDTSISLSLTL